MRNTKNTSARSAHRPIQIGMVGLGGISDVHIKTFLQSKKVQIRSVFDTETGRMEQRSKALGVKGTSFRNMLQDPDIDVIDILLPHYLHADYAVQAMNAGKHVICEKPLATTVKDVDRIITTARKTKKYVYLKQYLRFVSLHEKLREYIRRGVIGKPYLVHCLFTTNSTLDYANPQSWRGNTYEAGGGVFMDVGVHMVDLLQYMFGDPISVVATAKRNFSPLPQKGEDLIVLTLEFTHSLTVNIVCTSADTSWGFRWEKQFFGSEGALFMEDNGKEAISLKVRKNKSIVFEQREAHWWDHANQMALFDIINRIAAHQEPLVSLADARVAVQTICMAYESSRTGNKKYFIQ